MFKVLNSIRLQRIGIFLDHLQILQTSEAIPITRVKLLNTNQKQMLYYFHNHQLHNMCTELLALVLIKNQEKQRIHHFFFGQSSTSSHTFKRNRCKCINLSLQHDVKLITNSPPFWVVGCRSSLKDHSKRMTGH